MLRLSDARRLVLTQAFPAVGHLAVGGLVFGQFLRDQPFSIPLAVGGVVLWIVFVSFAVVIAGDRR